FSPAMLRASAGHFPGVGWLVGAVAAGVYALFAVLLPETTFTPLVAAVLSTVATVLMTGGFHEDGLADVADGLGGSYDRDRALEIMKDSRVGAFGAMALSLVLLAKVALVALLGSVNNDLLLIGSALFAGHVVSRTLPLLLIYWMPHVGDTAASKSKPLADQISLSSLLTAFTWCFIALAFVIWAQAAINLIVACSFATVALLWMGALFKRRLQGFTGDCLGATQQVCEIAFYLGLAVAL
ncbi:MAG: adenosylcobinamide-GDP ribazoletransferase, partial [Polaromonas sp.]|nr:adenosylcobinamide-GDP ribazoletransferase [Polaromonas sp.]